MAKPVRVTAPAVQPVTLAEVKQHLKVLHTDDDVMLEALLQSAIDRLDGYSGILGRALINQTWRLIIEGWEYPIRLPLSPVSSVVVKYYDTANGDITFDAANYDLTEDDIGPKVEVKRNISWPSHYERRDAIRIDFVAGYGASAAAVPGPLKIAIKLDVQRLYDPLSEAEMRNYTEAYNTLVAPFRRV